MIRPLMCIVALGPTATACLAADPPAKKLTADEHNELEVQWTGLNIIASYRIKSGKYEEAETASRRALDVARRLYATATVTSTPACVVEVERL